MKKIFADLKSAVAQDLAEMENLKARMAELAESEGYQHRKVLETLEDEGWKRVSFSEYYCPKHGRDSETDHDYLFSPQVDSARFEGLKGRTLEWEDCNPCPELCEFEDWLETLVDGEDYVSLERELIQLK